MATKKQIRANRRGARKSTGPRTEAGKARVAQDAVPHGLTGRSPVLPDESREEFTAFAAGMLANLAPRGTLEVAFAARVADGMWRLLRIGRIEAACLARELAEAGDRAARLREIPGLPHCAALGEEHVLGAAFLKLDAGGLPNSLARYEAALQRGVERSLKLLQDTQKRRLERAEAALRNRADSRAAQAGQGLPAEQSAGPGEDYAALAAALVTPAPKPAPTSAASAASATGTAGRTGSAGTQAPSPAASAAEQAGSQFKADFVAAQAGQGFPATTPSDPMTAGASAAATSRGFTTPAQQTAGRPGTDAATRAQAAHPTAQSKADSPAAQAGRGSPPLQPAGAAQDARRACKMAGGASEPEPTRVPFPAGELRNSHQEAGQEAARAARRNEPDPPAAQTGQGSPRPRTKRNRPLPPFPACKIAGY